jgi:glycosyltransferase involved in cell wall biosynthesis
MNRFAFHVGEELSKRGSLQAITNSAVPLHESWVRTLPFGNTFLEPALRKMLRELSPAHCVYIPRASLTTASMYRAWRLHRMAPRCRLHIVGLQRRALGMAGRLLARRSDAHFYAPSRFMADQLAAAKLSATVLMPGVDTQRFRPATPDEKRKLRAEWRIPENRWTVVHVGPLRRSRNPAWFEVVAQQPETHLVLVGSESHAGDQEVLAALPRSNVFVHTSYVPNIEDVYRLADTCLFPVQVPTGAIEWPLSVLEALACGVPVLAYPFGGLADITDRDCGIVFIHDATEIPAALAYVRSNQQLGERARRWAEQRTWPAMLSPLLDAVQEK